MDAFFASIEQLDNPLLKGKPVIVGGDPRKRGVVAACSYEARVFGIHSAMPCSRAVKLCPSAIFTPPRMWRYKEISASIMAIFSQYTDVIEPVSVDEAYLDVTQNKTGNPSATRLAERIRKHVYSQTGLTASAGISYNKFLAKVASDLKKPNGQSVIVPADAISFLNNLAIGKFHGVGHVTEKKMQNLGIKCGKQLRQFSQEDLVFHFGKAGLYFYNIVRGIDNRPVQPIRERKSIGSETTFQHDTKDWQIINNTLRELAEKIEKVILHKGYLGSTITLKIRYFDFTTITRSLTLATPIDSAIEIIEHIPKLTRPTELGIKHVRLLGITLSKLSDRNKRSPFQLKLPFMKS